MVEDIVRLDVPDPSLLIVVYVCKAVTQHSKALNRTGSRRRGPGSNGVLLMRLPDTQFGTGRRLHFGRIVAKRADEFRRPHRRADSSTMAGLCTKGVAAPVYTWTSGFF